MSRNFKPYGARYGSYKAKVEPEVYEANESDWDEDGNYIGGNDGGEDGGWDDEEEEEEDEWEEPQTQWYSVGSNNKGKEKAVRQVSDVGDDVYYDDLGLVNCWESALSDYKVSTASFGSP